MAQKEVLLAAAIEAAKSAFEAAMGNANDAADNANQAASDAQVNYEQVQDAIAEALTQSDVDPNYISYDIGSEPDSTGATTGTIGAYFTDSGLFHKLRWDGAVWQPIGDAVLSLSSLRFYPLSTDSIWQTPPQPSADEYSGPQTWDADQFINGIWEPLRATDPNYITRAVLGQDASGTYDIYKYVFEPPHYERTVVIGCNIHGNEVMSQLATHRFLYNVVHNWTASPHLSYARWKVRWVVVPMLNPWGVSQGVRSRKNSNGVDLNRNFDYNWANSPSSEPTSVEYKGTAPFSEVETQIYRDLVLNDYSEACGVMNPHDFVGQSIGSPTYYIYQPHSNLTNNRNLIRFVIDSIRTGSETYKIQMLTSANASNYFASKGYNSSNPEWTFTAEGTAEEFDSADMTAAVKWFGNLYLQYSLNNAPAVADFDARTRVYEHHSGNPPDIPQGATSEQLYPIDTFTVPTSGILLLSGMMVVTSTSDTTVTIQPHFGQDGTNFTASVSRFMMDRYVSIKAGDHAIIPINGVLAVVPGHIIRFGIQGRSSDSIASVRRLSAAITFIPSAHGPFRAYRFETGDTSRWYEAWPTFEVTP